MYSDSEIIATQVVLENLPIVKSLRKKLKKKEKENKKLIKILERFTRNDECEKDCCNIEDVKIKLEPTDEELKIEDLSTESVEIVKQPINKENIVYEIQDYTGNEVPKYKDEKEPDWDYKQIEKSMIKNVVNFSEKNADEVCSELSTDAVSEIAVEESEEEVVEEEEEEEERRKKRKKRKRGRRGKKRKKRRKKRKKKRKKRKKRKWKKRKRKKRKRKKRKYLK